MKAFVQHQFGGCEALQLEETDAPQPQRKQVRIRVHAAALNPKDVWVRKGRYAALSGRRFPIGTGFDVAGEIDAVGPGVSSLRVGQRVFGFLNGFRGRTCAEQVVMPEECCAPMPAGLAWPEAASLPLAATTALQALRDIGGLKAGDRVLLHGASGGVGLYATQIARAFGAHVVTTSSEASRGRCLEAGAHEALTYDDPAAPFLNKELYNVVFDIYGNRRFDWAQAGLADSGTFVTTVPSRRIVWDALRSLASKKRARLVRVRSRRRDIETLATLVSEGKLRPVIDRVLPFELVAVGHAYLEQRHAKGKIVIDVMDRTQTVAA